MLINRTYRTYVYDYPNLIGLAKKHEELYDESSSSSYIENWSTSSRSSLSSSSSSSSSSSYIENWSTSSESSLSVSSSSS